MKTKLLNARQAEKISKINYEKYYSVEALLKNILDAIKHEANEGKFIAHLNHSQNFFWREYPEKIKPLILKLEKLGYEVRDSNSDFIVEQGYLEVFWKKQEINNKSNEKLIV